MLTTKTTWTHQPGTFNFNYEHLKFRFIFSSRLFTSSSPDTHLPRPLSGRSPYLPSIFGASALVWPRIHLPHLGHLLLSCDRRRTASNGRSHTRGCCHRSPWCRAHKCECFRSCCKCDTPGRRNLVDKPGEHSRASCG